MHDASYICAVYRCFNVYNYQCHIYNIYIYFYIKNIYLQAYMLCIYPHPRVTNSNSQTAPDIYIFATRSKCPKRELSRCIWVRVTPHRGRGARNYDRRMFSGCGRVLPVTQRISRQIFFCLRNMYTMPQCAYNVSTRCVRHMGSYIVAR